MTTLQTSEILDLSADAIQERGWITGQGWNEAGRPVCLEGGIAAAMGITHEDLQAEDSDVIVGIGKNSSAYDEFQKCPAYLAVREYLRDELAETYPHSAEAGELDTIPLYFWNDRDDMTQERVVEVLRAAAAVERVKEATLVPAAA